MMSLKKPQKQKTRRHKVLFDKDSPYKSRVERLRVKYTRKMKHSLKRNLDYGEY